MSFSEAELKKMIRDAVREEHKASQSNAPTQTASEHVASCPECYSNVLETLNKTSEVICADCGLPLGSKEMASRLKSCPNCGCEDCEEVPFDEQLKKKR